MSQNLKEKKIFLGIAEFVVFWLWLEVDENFDVLFCLA